MRVAVLMLSAVLLLCSCAAAYDRYMQEGQKYKDQKDLAKARASFHKAVLEARGDSKKRDLLINALLAEKDCAVLLSQTDAAVNLLTEACRTLESMGNYKKAGVLQRQTGELLAPSDPSAGLDCFESGLADLKKGGFEVSPETAAIYADIGDLKSGQNDNKGSALYLEKACGLLDKIKYNENDHDHAVYLHKLAFIYQKLNRDDDAMAADEKAKGLEVSGIKGSVGRLQNLAR